MACISQRLNEWVWHGIHSSSLMAMQVVAALRSALAVAESTARIAAWSRDAAWSGSREVRSVVDSHEAIAVASEARSSPITWPSDHSAVAERLEGAGGAWDADTHSCCSVPGTDTTHSNTAAGSAARMRQSDHDQQLGSRSSMFARAGDSAKRQLQHSASHQSLVRNASRPQ